MISKFLISYPDAEHLDAKRYKRQFPQGKGRADFLLFGGRAVCEIKELCSIKMEQKVEKLWRKGALPREVFDRELNSSIWSVMESADKQLRDTREVLCLPNGLGLLVLENLMPNVISGPAILGAADKAMQAGLPDIQCTLCLDFINGYTRSSDGKVFRFGQMLLRDTQRERSIELSQLFDPVFREFCAAEGIPIEDMEGMSKFDSSWIIDSNTGRFVSHKAMFE